MTKKWIKSGCCISCGSGLVRVVDDKMWCFCCGMNAEASDYEKCSLNEDELRECLRREPGLAHQIIERVHSPMSHRGDSVITKPIRIKKDDNNDTVPTDS